MAKKPRPFTVDGEDFLELSSGTVVSISELTRIYRAVFAQAQPGMTEQQMFELIAKTVIRMRPN
jgi:hypothetical protein